VKINRPEFGLESNGGFSALLVAPRWSATKKRALSSALFRRVEVPLWRSNEGSHIQEAGFAASLAGESGRYGDV